MCISELGFISNSLFRDGRWTGTICVIHDGVKCLIDPLPEDHSRCCFVERKHAWKRSTTTTTKNQSNDNKHTHGNKQLFNIKKERNWKAAYKSDKTAYCLCITSLTLMVIAWVAGGDIFCHSIVHWTCHWSWKYSVYIWRK